MKHIKSIVIVFENCDSVEIPAEFIEITVSDYFKESIPDEPEQNQPIQRQCARPID